MARLGGDEFAVLLPTVPRRREPPSRWPSASGSPSTRRSSSRACCSSWRPPSASRWRPTHGNDVEQLLRCADIAMYVAKDERTRHRDLLRRPRPTLDQPARPARRPAPGDRRRRARAALPAQGLAEPRHGHRRRGPGALAAPARAASSSPTTSSRWPSSSGLMHKLTALRRRHRARPGGRVVGPRAAGPGRRQRLGPRPARRRRSPGRSPTVSSGTGCPAEAIRLELTERILMAEPARVADSLAELDRLGVRLSLDDFGTGYSSLVLLQRLPGQRDQGRPLVRPADGGLERGRRDRPLDHRPGPRARHRRRRRGRRERRGLGHPVRARLRQRAGLVRRPPDVRRCGHRVAAAAPEPSRRAPASLRSGRVAGASSPRLRGTWTAQGEPMPTRSRPTGGL